MIAEQSASHCHRSLSINPISIVIEIAVQVRILEQYCKKGIEPGADISIRNLAKLVG